MSDIVHFYPTHHFQRNNEAIVILSVFTILLLVQYAYPNIWLVILFMSLTLVVLQCGDGRCIEAASAAVDLLVEAWEKQRTVAASLWGKIGEWLSVEIE